MRLLLLGATGFVGRALVPALRAAGHDCLLITRHPSAVSTDPHLGFAVLPAPSDDVAWTELLRERDAVINLAGASIAGGRWTRRRKDTLWSSRVSLTQRLVAAMRQATSHPKLLLNASGIGYYGDRGETILTEEAAHGSGFLAELATAWEGAALAACETGIRVVCLRFGMILGLDTHGGGALGAMLPPFRWGLGGRLGSGRQWLSWIHRDDVVALILWCLEHAEISGPLNVTSPTPVTNADFTRALGHQLHRPTVCSVPAPLLRLVLGEMATLLLASQRAIPARALAGGYRFRYPELDRALAACLTACLTQLSRG